jgi:hypothetical protein
MDFEFSEDQQSLRDAVQRWVDKGYGFERRRAVIKSGGFSAGAWRELGELGLLGLALPEAQGGMGFGATEAMVVMEELGRGIVLEPYAAVALVAAPMLAASRAPEAAAWMQGVADGSALIVLAHQERRARYRLAHVETVATQDSAGNWLISGAKSLVPAVNTLGRTSCPPASVARWMTRRAPRCSWSRAVPACKCAATRRKTAPVRPKCRSTAPAASNCCRRARPSTRWKRRSTGASPPSPRKLLA